MADSGIAALDDLIARLRALAGAQIGARVAAKAVPGVDAALKKTAKAGTTPDGQPWQVKKDGGRPLKNAASKISTEASGNLVIATLTGPEAFHHRGARGAPVRQILPDSGTIPEGVRKALLEAAEAVFKEVMGK